MVNKLRKFSRFNNQVPLCWPASIPNEDTLGPVFMRFVLKSLWHLFLKVFHFSQSENNLA